MELFMVRVYKAEEVESWHSPKHKYAAHLKGETKEGATIEVTIYTRAQPPAIGTTFPVSFGAGIEPEHEPDEGGGP